MHELSIATAVVERAERVARRSGAARVSAVRVLVGELAGVVPDALRFSFRLAGAGTLVQGARLLVDAVPAMARCEPCDTTFAVGTPPALWCPACDTPTSGVVSGRELEIATVELEQPEQPEQGAP